MLNMIVITALSALLMSGAVTYVYFDGEERECLATFIRKNKLFICTCASLFVLILALEVWYFATGAEHGTVGGIKWVALLWGILTAADIDRRDQRIPNRLVLIMLGIRACILVYEAITSFEFITNVLLYPALGAVIGGAIMLVAKLLSRNGIGMGDVKMFIVVGAFVGSAQIIATIFYIFLIAAIWGIILLIGKKATMKDAVPLAPLAFAGILTEYLLLMIGGNV